jgi:hypothetical protein
LGLVPVLGNVVTAPRKSTKRPARVNWKLSME